jgi:predicted nucleotidyltransferase
MAPPRKPSPLLTPPKLTAQQRDHWLRHWTAQANQLERRRGELLTVAAPVAAELRARWPQISIWLFGSTLGPGFHADSDLDLAVAGLPADALIEALEVAERCAMRVAERQGLAPIAMDLVRLESLPLHWQERIQRDGQRLR